VSTPKGKFHFNSNTCITNRFTGRTDARRCTFLSGNFGVRALIQFGVLHPPEGPDAFPNILGFGPEKFIGVKSYRPPTKTFEDGKTFQLTIAGELVEVAPNRTDVRNSVGFYFPNQKTLVTNALGGGFMFNLYTLRGDRIR
jgi:alkyl sulfatase BDS1-like metallo-beta-lactamase superfamily hydrolase